MSGREDPNASGAPMLIAIALWLCALAPQWVIVFWGIKHLDRLRMVLSTIALKLLAFAVWIAAILLAIAGTVFVCRDLLGPERLELQRIVANVTLGQDILLAVVAIFLLSRRRTNNARRPGLNPKPIGTIWRLVLGWAVGAVVLCALALGPFAGHAGVDEIWRGFALAAVAIAVLLCLLVAKLRRERHGREDR